MIFGKHVSYSYKTTDENDNVTESFKALDHIDVHIRPGEFVAVLGRNGSGKSTLARHINALLVPDDGEMIVGGFNTKPAENLLKVRKTAGMVFQNPDNQIIAGTVEEDTAFGPENLGVPTTELRRRVDEALEAVSMLKEKHRSPNSLSGGQKQRVAVAGVLAMKPQCIILDEPTAMHDPAGRKEILQTVKKLNDAGITIVLITHHMEEALAADRIIVMNEGRIVMDGSPHEVFSQVDRLHSMHLDVPKVTELAYRLKKSGIDLGENIITNDEFITALKRYLSRTF